MKTPNNDFAYICSRWRQHQHYDDSGDDDEQDVLVIHVIKLFLFFLLFDFW